MPTSNVHKQPATGWKGFRLHWRNDSIAAFSVALVALPLCLGIALASGFPPIAGVWSAIIGGLLTTFLRGSYVAINGPAAGLIAVILGALVALDDGSGRAINYVLAVFIVSGAIQVLLGVLRLGRLANVFPASVIQGILAAIGVIIFGKQIHVALGVNTEADSIIGILLAIPSSISQLNPAVTIISLLSILLLIFHARISYKLFHFLPAPMWVLVLSIPIVYLFNFFDPHMIQWGGIQFEVGPDYLVSLPDDIWDSFMYPDFSVIHTVDFWLAVVAVTLIGSIETLASAKAIEKLDPYRRKTNLNREMIGVGLSSMLAGAIGALPVLTVIVRSSVNIQNNAKTAWSNFMHGVLLLVFLLLLTPFIQMVPLGALAAILVFTGFRLASPRIFKQAMGQGVEQFLFLTATLVLTLFTNLLWGIIGGILLTTVVHLLLSRVSASSFFRYMVRPVVDLTQEGKQHHLYIRGIANFLTLLRIGKTMDSVPDGESLTVDLKEARLVDLTVLEYFKEFGKSYEDRGGIFSMEGLAYHVSSSNHPLALRSLTMQPPATLTPRQKTLEAMAQQNGWDFEPGINWEARSFRHFQFFETRPIEYKDNVIRGRFEDLGIDWQINDITFDEGALQATEVYHTTVALIRMPYAIPKFVLEKEDFFDKLFDRVLEFAGRQDIDFKLFTGFSKKFLLKGEDETAIRQFFTASLIRFFEQEEIYHIESNGEALLLFKYLRLAKPEDASKMLAFSRRMLDKLEKGEE